MTGAALAESLGVDEREFRSDLDVVNAVSAGLPTSAVDAVIHSGILSSDEVDRLVVPLATLQARGGEGALLTPEESDRLVRVVRIVVLAHEHFGDPARAAGWLRRPNRGLRGAVPLELLRTGEGARVVEESMFRLVHGIFA